MRSLHPGIARLFSESQRAMIAAKYARLNRGFNQHTSIEGPSIEKAAELLHIGRASVERARIVQDRAAPQLAQAVDRGEIPVSTAAKLVDLGDERRWRRRAAWGEAAI